MIKSTDPMYASLKAAQDKQLQILAIKVIVEQAGPAGRDPTQVNDLQRG